MPNDVAFDQGRSERFSAELLAALNHGALCLMISIGHRTGLFDAMRDAPPLSSGTSPVRPG